MPLHPGETMVSILDSASSFSSPYDYTAKNQGRRSKSPQKIDVAVTHRGTVLFKIDLAFTYVVQVCRYRHTASFIYFDCFTA
ncbi:hypothetical protein QQF64_010850 [Cirrhinus molitorella]|uniref:Uncharacterized protein n=1 Tax=Cirrhinus molitorella TaxID=172907 RepID=A0ABR3LZZ8_9TELE